MSLHVVSVIVPLAVFVVGTLRPVNLWPRAGGFVFSLALGAATFLLFGGRALMKEPRTEVCPRPVPEISPGPADEISPGPPRDGGPGAEVAAAGHPATPPSAAAGGGGAPGPPPTVVLTATLPAITGVGVGALGALAVTPHLMVLVAPLTTWLIHVVI
ncbi:hypothetical protein FXF51_04340 [Nonomuraea sp. PA05]|uniref:hypothetical protein n=1 Tax=Nonomuraea sp. PA05 TaxID=2604466 RepID=UPI0011DC1120|nr:hypothetical protein [Nonomuraea sp. PA05]TYB70292.1 hypothetical protein FXF51_04340 [Nonomuraea sp. PA05]